MKALIVILGLLISIHSQAMCAGERFDVAFFSDELNPNSCLIFEGYGMAQDFIKDLSGKVNVYLESDTGDKVALQMIDYNDGAFRINQAIFQPQQALEVGANYQLQFDGLDKSDYLPFELSNGNGNDRYNWVVHSTQIKPLAKLLIEPRFLENQVMHLGCGPSVNAEFEFITDSDEPILVKTELMDMTDQSVQRYFVTKNHNDTIRLGHGMCSGAHKFKTDHEYQVRFSIMDDCNLYRDEWTDWIAFDNPVDY